jgi:flavin reductase (DIM6/NTAB) family NADH-FMN oxidoreductase RutF
MYYSKADIFKTDRVTRLNLINSISGAKSANLIGTKSDSGQSNLAIFSSVVHLGSDPAYLGFVLRPDSKVRRHTFENIESNGCYTINSIGNSFIENAHYTSAKFPSDQSEFDQCFLEEEYLNDFRAPFVKASKLKMALKMVEMVDIKINASKLIIGSIEHLHVESSSVDQNGQINLQKIGTVAIGGLNRYYDLNQIGHFPYARLTDLPVFKKK